MIFVLSLLCSWIYARYTLIAEVGRSFYELADVEPLYAADGVHPSEAGSRIAASLIAAAIQQHKENLL